MAKSTIRQNLSWADLFPIPRGNGHQITIQEDTNRCLFRKTPPVDGQELALPNPSGFVPVDLEGRKVGQSQGRRDEMAGDRP
jgi:hypothetical protein